MKHFGSFPGSDREEWKSARIGKSATIRTKHSLPRACRSLILEQHRPQSSIALLLLLLLLPLLVFATAARDSVSPPWGGFGSF